VWIVVKILSQLLIFLILKSWSVFLASCLISIRGSWVETFKNILLNDYYNKYTNHQWLNIFNCFVIVLKESENLYFFGYNAQGLLDGKRVTDMWSPCGAFFGWCWQCLMSLFPVPKPYTVGLWDRKEGHQWWETPAVCTLPEGLTCSSVFQL
jgi:hypothetical protein